MKQKTAETLTAEDGVKPSKMKTYIFSLGLIFMASVFQADGSLILTANPTVIEADLTKSLIVNCSFHEPGSGNLVVSLIMKKEDGGASNATLTELAHINTYLGGLPVSNDPTNATAVGQIDASRGSYLSLQWDYPSFLESGTYVCEGYVMNIHGEVHPQSAQATVGTSAPQVAQVVERIQEIETNLKHMVSNVASLTSMLATQQQNIAELQTVKNDWKNVLFSSTPLYKDENGARHYHLSRFQPQNARNAEAACTTLGGYLAEVDNQLEYNFIVNFVKSALEGSINVLLGGMQDNYGYWKSRRNGKALGYTHWYSYFYDAYGSSNSTNSSTDEQCQSISAYHSQSIYMEKISCFNSNNQILYFLCEDENI